MEKIIIVLIILGFLLPIFSIGQLPVEPPKTIDEAKQKAYEAIDIAEEKMPGILERMWKEEVLPTWRAMWEWFSNLWNRHIRPRIDVIWQRIQELLGKEIEKRKPIIEEELQKEKQEIKQELPVVGQSLWERFKELIR